MAHINTSEIELNNQLTSLIHFYTKIKRLNYEVQKWLYQQKLQFDENSSFLYHIYTSDIGETLEVHIIGKSLKYHTMKCSFQQKNQKLYQYITLLNDTIEIKIKYDSEYPFCPPCKILINKINYISLLKCSSSDLKILKINKNCLCCSSLMCKNNWGPTLNLFNILDEVESTLKIKKGIINYIFCNVIKRKYLIDDIPLFQYLY